MRDTLYIQLRDLPPDGQLAYALAGAQAQPGVTAEHGTLEQILGLAAGKRLVLFVPGADVRLASVQVPARQPQKVLLAAPYALEDELAEDVDTLHFAIGPRQADGSHPVAVVSRARMDGWLAPFSARGLRPEAVLPETLCLPMPAEQRWSALAEGGAPRKDAIAAAIGADPAPGRVTVRTAAYSGFACDVGELPTYLQLADPDGKIPLRLFVPRSAETDFTRLNRPVELLPGYGSGIEVLVRHWQPAASINLMQGSYAQQEDWQRHVAPWRTAAAIAAAWVVLALVYEGAQSWRLGGELREQEARNIARFQELFPNETRIVDLAVQAEQQWAALRGGTGRAPLFQMMAALAAGLSANPGLTLQTLQFRDGALYLQLTASDLQAYEKLREWFSARRETLVDPQSVNASAEGVQIRLKLTLA